MTTENANTNQIYTKDPRSLTKFVKVMLWISIATGIIYLISDLMQMNLLSSSFSQSEAEANDARQGAVGILFLVVFIVTGIAFFKWTYRANVNCRGFGADGMKFTPGWTVGWYFVPFMNLFKPYQALKEIWQVSNNPSNWLNQGGNALLGWWWAMWIIGGILGQISFRMAMAATNKSSLEAATSVSIVSDLVSILTAWLLLAIVSKISDMQENVVNQ